MQVARQQEIVNLARKTGRVNVEQLSLHFGVSPQTIRKDLKELSDRRLLDRVHGGAIVASSAQNLAYQARRSLEESEKREIGRAAAALIPSNSSLFLNIGTTTEEVARALMHHMGLLLITNNLHVASMLYPYAGIDVIIAGGPVRHSDGGVVGASAVDMIQTFKVDFAVMGVSAIDADGDLLDFDMREIAVAQTIIANARMVMLVADSSKFVRCASARIGHLREIDVFVTDKVPSAAFRALCAREKVRLVETATDWNPDDPGLAPLQLAGVSARDPLTA